MNDTHPVADLLPMLPDAEIQELADRIAANGLIRPITLLADGRLLDGRHRLAACKLAGVEPRYDRYTGDEPVSYALSLETRDLTPGQRAMRALAVLPFLEDEAKAHQSAAGESTHSNQHSPESQLRADLPEAAQGPRARDLAAVKANSSGRAVAQAKRVTENAPDLAEKVLAGTIALDRAERIVRDRAAETRQVEDAREEAAVLDIRASIDIRHGDFREVLADIHDVDAIITDPPYPHEYLPLLDDLAQWADKVLKPDGVLVVLFGQTYLPDVYRRLEGGRPYRWTACYQTPGGGYVSHVARCQSNWKPLLVYGGGPRFGDVFQVKGDTGKALHKWGQNYSAFHDIVRAFTKPGDLVADPFMGAGTTLLAAHAQGRDAVGADIDAEHVATTRERLR